MKVWTALGLALTCVFATTNAQASYDYSAYGFRSANQMHEYFTLSTIEVEENAIPESEMNSLLPNFQIPATATSMAVEAFLDPASIQTWITIGAKVWQVVVANKPVANVGTQRISVLPVAQPDWAKMENWQGPAAKQFVINVKNGFGTVVVKHAYTIAYNYGGQLGGKGSFLANATVIPSKINVLWGFSLDSQVEIGQVINTSSTDDPTPGVDVQLGYKINSVLSHIEGRDTFFLKGNGEMMQISGTGIN
jgi:hypothetical protein